MSDDSFVVSDEELPSASVVAAISTKPVALEVENQKMGSLASDKEEAKEEAPPSSPPPLEQEPIPVPVLITLPAEAPSIPPPKVAPSPPKKSPQKPAQPPSAASKPSKADMCFPVMNLVTMDANTYDLDRLMSPKLQKKAETKDRFSPAHLVGGKKKGRNSASQDFVKLNKSAAGKRIANYSYDEASLRKRASIDLHGVDDRFYSYQRTVQEKIKKMEEEKMMKELQECTFAPSLVAKRRSSTDGPRSADVFFQEMIRHQTYVQSKVKALREESSKTDPVRQNCVFHPQLCKKSLEMLSAKGEPAVPAHEKLYHAHKASMQKQMKQAEMVEENSETDESDVTQDSVKPFTPAINKTSLMIVREKPIEVLLHEDAERRAQKLKAAPSVPVPKPQISSNSVSLLLTRFKDDFSTAWAAVDEEQSGELRYTNVAEVLKKLKFVDNDSEKGKLYETERTLMNNLWAIVKLRDDGAISKANLETVLLAVMNFPVKESEPKPLFEVKEDETPSDSKGEKQREGTIHIGRVEEGVLYLNPGDGKRIYHHFKAWYDHKNASVSKAQKDEELREKYEPTYKPELSKNSKKMTDMRLAKLAADGFTSYEDFLMSEATKKSERQIESERKKERELKKKCPFQPVIDHRSARLINSVEVRKKDNISGEYMQMLKEAYPNPRNKTELLYQLATISKVRKEQRAKTPGERQIEKCSLDLTFTPDTTKTIGYSNSLSDIALPAKGVEKAIQRLAHGRRLSQIVSSLRQTGNTNRGAWRFDPYGGDIPEEPMIILAMQINGRAQELRVHQGENIDATLQVFTAQHRLGGVEAEMIKEELKRQYMQATGGAAEEDDI